jgi:cytochrome c553
MQNLKKVCGFLLVVLVVLPGAGFSQSASRSGQALFTHYCAVCHGSTGEGASGPDLTNPLWQSSITDRELGNTVRDGIRGTTMPAFRTNLQPAEVQSLIEHLRTLAKDAIHPANELRAARIAVSPERLLRAEADPNNWLMYGRDYGNQRFSPLEVIHRENVT